MKNTITKVAFAAVIALSLLAGSTSVFAHDAKSGRETAWTLDPLQPLSPVIEPLGVTWEE
jgi:hypothetical protein